MDRRSVPVGLLVAVTLVALLSLVLVPAPGGGTARREGPTTAPVLPAIVPGTSGGTAADWGSFHGSANRSGYTPFAGPTGPGSDWYSCPSGFPIRDGPVSDGRFTYAANEVGTIFALNRSSNGSQVWNRTLPAATSQLEVAGANLYTGSTAGELYDLRTTDGAVSWNVSLGSSVIQAVTVVGGLAVVGTSAGTVGAFNASTGARLWQVSLGSAVGGALSAENGVIYAPTGAGTVVALDGRGNQLWSTRVGAGIDTAVAVSGTDVVVGDLAGNLTDLWATNGSLRWRWSAGSIGVRDPIEATPAVDPTRVYVAFDSGSVRAYGRADGRLLWQTPNEFTGLPNTVAPAVTPDGLYAVVNGVQEVLDLNLTNGNTTWADASPVLVFGPPAVDHGELFVGTEFGCVNAIGPRGAYAEWPVTGVVLTGNGTPVDAASVTLGLELSATDAHGRFSFLAPNGTYPVEVFAVGFEPYHGSVVVAGPVTVTLVILPLPLYTVVGHVVDQWTGAGLVGVVVDASAPLGFDRETVTGPSGEFRFELPNGTTTIRTRSFAGYGSGSATVLIAGTTTLPVLVAVAPTASAAGNSPYSGDALAVPALAVAVAGLGAWVRERNRRRALLGLPPGILSPFARFVAMRLLLLPVQVAALLAVVYAFGTVIPLAATHGSPATLDPSVGAGCAFSWSSLGCESTAIGSGLGTLWYDLFTGQWGWAAFGALQEPVTVYLGWWLPDSIELGVIALAISMAVAYPVALLAGWRRGGAADVASRLASLAGLLVPSFLLALLLILAVGVRFLHAFGDLPFGTFPSDDWFVTNGGFPAWIGLGDSTSPTHFPLIDGAIHGDWAFERLVAAKVLLQALAISVVYLTVFLRHAWSVVAQAAREPHLQAARARGVAEPTLLWRHTGRRVLPYYLLTFALTLPAFLGTQALVEALFSAQGVGAILLLEITHLSSNAPGFSGPVSGNLYQVVVFLLALLILASTLVADIVARYLDPRLRTGVR